MFMESIGYKGNLFVGNALIDMYAKCGVIEKALDVFDRGGSVIGVVILCNPLELVSWGMLVSHVYSKLRVSL